jgi:hypothetical protein
MSEIATVADITPEDLTPADLEIAELDLSDLELTQLTQEEIDAILNLEASTTTNFIQPESFYPTPASFQVPQEQTAFISEPDFAENAADVDTISSLTDLFGDTATTVEPVQPDSYPAASPEEVLLPDAAIAMPDLVLDEATLSRLSQDLSNLELGENPASLPQPEQQQVDVADWTLEDWMQEPAQPATLEHPPQANWIQEPAQPAPPVEQPALEDWSDTTLDDFAAALPETELAETSIEELSPISTTDPSAFTLEGMDNLFADFPAAPVSQSPKPDSSDVADPIAQSADQGQPDLLSLEEMQDLFGEELGSTAALAAPPAQQTTPEPASAFTLEGLDDLFGDVPVAEPTPVSVADTPTTFTLEGMEDLFGEVSATSSTSTVNAPVNAPDASVSTPLTEEPLPFSLEGIEDLFADLPAVVPPSGTEQSIAQPPTLSNQPLQHNPTQFRLEQVDDLFIEVLPDESQPSPTDPV